MDFLKANLSSIAVQLSDHISEIWLSTYVILFRGEIAIIYTGFRWGQNCHNISSMKKTLNGLHFLFRLQYNYPVVPSNIQDWQRSCQHFFDMLILFCGEDYCSVSWNVLSHRRLPNIWLAGECSDPNGTIHTQAFGVLKKATRPGRRFLIESRCEISR